MSMNISELEIKPHLFFHFDSSNNMKINKSIETITLDSRIYSQVKSSIVQKLGDHAKNYIANIII